MGSSRYLDLVDERVVVYDGATGTYLQEHDLTADDFGGPDLEGCNEILVRHPARRHRPAPRRFFEVGADVVETNTFGAFAIPLGEYDIADAVPRDQRRRRPHRPRGGRRGHGRPASPARSARAPSSPSLGQISFAELRDAYEVQAAGLLEGGVDLLLIETQFDLLGLKAAMIGARRAMAAAGREVPIQVQVTIELTGRMLPGTEIGAALAAIDPLRPDVIGLNCATGPAEMSEHLRHLSQHARMPISCLPNAGLPSVVDGKMHYDLTPEQLAEYHDPLRHRARRAGHRRLLRHHARAHRRRSPTRCRDLTPAARDAACTSPAPRRSTRPCRSSRTPSFLIIGERTNANGSKKFRDAMLDGRLGHLPRRWPTTRSRKAPTSSTSASTTSAATAPSTWTRSPAGFATQVDAPLVLDSTEPQVMEAGLQWIGGRAILNSANLEDGDAPGSRLDRVFTLAKEYGAAVICLLIDEEGQARDVEWKMRVAHRIHDLAVDALRPRAGRPHLRRADLPAVDRRRRPAQRRHGHHRGHPPHQGRAARASTPRSACPTCPSASSPRPATSSTRCSCTSASRPASTRPSSTPSKIMPLNRIPDEQREVCLDLIYDRRGTAGALSTATTTTTRCRSCSRSSPT